MKLFKILENLGRLPFPQNLGPPLGEGANPLVTQLVRHLPLKEVIKVQLLAATLMEGT